MFQKKPQKHRKIPIQSHLGYIITEAVGFEPMQQLP